MLRLSSPLLRVQPVPSAHPFVRNTRRTGSAVRHLPDPPVPGAPPGQWWPPPALDADWVRRTRGTVDLFHVHFGFESVEPERLEAWVEALDGIPYVLTVHDLQNPHLHDQRRHGDQLDVLVPAAAAVATLTPGAATAIRSRWHTDVQVIPHPHVAPLQEVGLPTSRPVDRFVVGLHLRALRANVRVGPLVTALAGLLATLPGAELWVHLHREVVDPGHPRHDPALLSLLARLHADGALRLTIHEPHDDPELFDHLRQVDLSVLPYAFGTHSGWVELCHDLGTAVLAPRTGFWHEQQRLLPFDWTPEGTPEPDGLAQALRQAYEERPRWAADRGSRSRQRREVSTAHERLYRRVLSTAGAASSEAAS